MKIPPGTKWGFYWVKYRGVWYAASICKIVGWVVSLAGLKGTVHASKCDELGPKLSPPQEGDFHFYGVD